MLISKRPTKIGSSINGRTEYHGDDHEPAMDVTFRIVLEAHEVNEINKDPHMADAWFVTTNGNYGDPMMKNYKPFKANFKFKESSAKVWVGIDATAIEFENVMISKLSFQPMDFGKTALTFKLATLANNANIPIMLWMDAEADIEVTLGKQTAADLQIDLDLPTPSTSTGELVAEGFIDADDLTAAQAASETPLPDHDQGDEEDELKKTSAETHIAEREIAQAIEADRAGKPKTRRRRSFASVN